MEWIRVLLVVLLTASGALPLSTQTRSIAERLGHPAGTKLLILHADDLGVAHSVDAASLDALDKNAVSSASVMMPCPWVTEVAAYRQSASRSRSGAAPHIDERVEDLAGAASSRATRSRASSIPPGTLCEAGTEAVATHVKPEEAEREIRAQINSP